MSGARNQRPGSKDPAPAESAFAPPPDEKRYIEIRMPDWFDLLVPDGNGGWVSDGMFPASDFMRAPDGSYGTTGTWYLPRYLRAIAQRGEYVDTIDGGGNVWTCRLVPTEPPDELDQ
jgi:hypothetical protein